MEHLHQFFETRRTYEQRQNREREPAGQCLTWLQFHYSDEGGRASSGVGRPAERVRKRRHRWEPAVLRRGPYTQFF